MSHNSIEGKSGAMLAEGIERNESLLHFIIDDNPLGLTAARLLMRASPKGLYTPHVLKVEPPDCLHPKGNKERELSMLRCGNSNMAKEASVFDPSSPDGDYELDMSNAYSAVVLEHIIKHISSGTGVFASKDPKLPGVAELDGRKWSCPAFNAVKEGRATLPSSGLLAFRSGLWLLVMRHTLCITRHTSHVTRHTSHVTRHTSHVTRHTSHVTLMQVRERAARGRGR
jgi:hypothetical protein